MKQFSTLGLAEPLLRALAAEGHTTPTPIQAGAIPPLLAGDDVLGIAQTGTGKTAAFVLPLLDRLAARRRRPAARTCGALILTPTRELAGQIAEAIRSYGRFLRPSVAVVVGGAGPGPQIRALAAGVDIVVATPGRLLDHMSSGAIGLGETDMVVLDEADQMLDLGFLPPIRRILSSLPELRQTVLMSATMPKAIRALARDFQSRPVEVRVAPAATPVARVAQSVMHVDRASKRRLLTEILCAGDVARAIVFTRTKRGADRLHLHLKKAGLAAGTIHGDKSQAQRERALKSFRAGRTAILVATDVAARGIDIDDVTHVFNFDLPHVAEAYVHRIGRTARAGREGIAISLCDPGERGLLRDIERLIGSPLDRQAATVGGGIVTAPHHLPAAPAEGGPHREKTGGRRRRRRSGGAARQGGGGRGARPASHRA